MSSQLRADIVRAFAAARDQVKGHRANTPGLVDDVTRLIDGALRFLDQDRDIWDARRAVLERLESAVLLMDREAEQDVPANGEGRSHRAVQTARSHAVEAINHLQAQVLAHGRLNDAGDRVGLGKAGALLR